MRVAMLAAAVWLCAVGHSLAANAPANAREPTDIPAQQLGAALQTLGRERGLQIVYRTDVVGELRTEGAQGELTPAEAITQLLSGTGLTYHYLDDTTLTIVPAAAGRLNEDGKSVLPGDNGRAIELEEIVVTAQKVSELASRTPLALSVYTGESLNSLGVTNVTDLQDIVPGLSVGQSPAGVNISIRGVATTDVTSKGDQSVVFNIDGIPVGRQREMGLALFDLERVEVLRGPQGTLYGKSATGGAINVITNKPQDTFAASAEAGLGDYNMSRANVMLNVPLNGNFALRAAANVNVRDGYLDPVIGEDATGAREPARQDQNNLTGRLSGLWNITDVANLLLTGTAGRVSGVGSLYSAIYHSIVTKSGAAARAVYRNPFGGSVDDHFRNVNAELNADIRGTHLTFDGAHLWYEAHDMPSSDNDPAGNPPVGNVGSYGWTNYRGTYTTDSYELRFSNGHPQRVEWVAGTNYYSEDIQERDQNWNAPLDDPTVSASTNNVGILADTRHKSTALFAQTNLHATEQFKLTLGLRRSSDSVSRRGTFAAGAGPWLDSTGSPCTAPNDCIGVPNNGDQSASKVTYRVGADYQLTSNQMIYASVATGYKAGGFNDYDPSTQGTKTYDPGQLTAYEAGYKGQVLSNLQFNSTGFYYDYSKNQISSLIAFFDSTPPTLVLYTRAVPTIIYGWESELHYRITAADLLDVTLSLERSRYRRFQAGLTENVDWSGYSLDNTPSAATTLAYAHRWFVADGAWYQARVSSKYSSGYLVSDFIGATQYRQQAFTRSDLALSYSSGSGRFGVQVYVRNIEDQLQLLGAPANASATVVDAANVPVTEPRMFGISTSIKF